MTAATGWLIIGAVTGFVLIGAVCLMILVYWFLRGVARGLAKLAGKS